MKSVATILHWMQCFSTRNTVCAFLKLTDYKGKPKAELFCIIGMGKSHSKAESRGPTKNHNGVFHLINVLVCDDIAPKFEKLGGGKEKIYRMLAWHQMMNTFARGF